MTSITEAARDHLDDCQGPADIPATLVLHDDHTVDSLLDATPIDATPIDRNPDGCWATHDTVDGDCGAPAAGPLGLCPHHHTSLTRPDTPR